MKNLVICCDGTWNRPDAEYPTNVVKLARNLVNDFVTQTVYYDTGVGTGGKLDAAVGGATGEGVKENIREAYRFVLHNYQPGDRLFLFGFSRGAFTVRSLGGLIYKCGILKDPGEASIDRALELYKTDDHPDDPPMTNFRAQYALGREVYFIGVWDTVGALGVPVGWVPKKLSEFANGFHDTKLSPLVRHACQALAIDERREAFEPTFWQQSSRADAGQVLEQVWFAGAHADVGGGYAETGLSDIALHWMQEKARAAGLAFKPVPAYVPQPQPAGVLHDPARDWSLPTDARDLRQGGLVFHASVRERLQQDATYQPQNLMVGNRKAVLDALVFVGG
jgi:uncharacterized protein (DUF2235 family)